MFFSWMAGTTGPDGTVLSLPLPPARPPQRSTCAQEGPLSFSQENRIMLSSEHRGGSSSRTVLVPVLGESCLIRCGEDFLSLAQIVGR